MKQVKLVLFLILFVVMVCSCSRGSQIRKDSGLTAQGVEVWLDSKATAAPNADLSGKWDAGSAFAGGWGEGNIIQEKAKFNGLLGMYSIKGIVSGSDAYFALMSNGTVYYTGMVTMQADGSFNGKTAKDVLVDTEAAKTAEIYAITFQKMN